MVALEKALNNQILYNNQVPSAPNVTNFPHGTFSTSSNEFRSIPRHRNNNSDTFADNKDQVLCHNPYFITVTSSDGIPRRFRCRCKRTDPCPVCRKKLAKLHFGKSLTAIESMKKPKMLALTFNVDYLPGDSTPEQNIEALRGSAFDSFRRRVLSKCRSYVVAVEFGPKTNRAHYHLIIDDPDDVLPTLHTRKGMSYAKFMSLLVANPPALAFFNRIYAYGFGIFNCEKLRSVTKGAHYVTNYITKQLPDIFNRVEFSHLRTHRYSNDCAKLAQLPKRHAYKSRGIKHHTATGHMSEVPMPTFAMLHPMDLDAAIQQDLDFQMAGTDYTDDFFPNVKRLFKYRRMKDRLRTKIKDVQFLRRWSFLTRKSRYVSIGLESGYYWMLYLNSFPDSSSEIRSYVRAWCQFYRYRYHVTHFYNCTATLRFLAHVVSKL